MDKKIKKCEDCIELVKHIHKRGVDYFCDFKEKIKDTTKKNGCEHYREDREE